MPAMCPLRSFRPPCDLCLSSVIVLCPKKVRYEFNISLWLGKRDTTVWHRLDTQHTFWISTL